MTQTRHEKKMTQRENEKKMTQRRNEKKMTNDERRKKLDSGRGQLLLSLRFLEKLSISALI